MADRGEFTLRAFLSGRIDLTQAEAVLGVIDAADPRKLQVAVAQLAGGLAGPLHHLRDLLLELLAHLEAGFDFADEDLPFITAEQLQRGLDEAVENVARLAAQMESRGTVQTAVRAVLLGRPNTGKSSLFNALTSNGQALVSDTPGTTRDYLLAELDFDGRKCQLIDTAGFLAESVQAAGDFNTPDRAAQAAAAEQIDRADLRLLCLDATRPLHSWEQAELARVDDLHRIVVWTKLDAIPPGSAFPSCEFSNQPTILTSSVTGQGLDLLLSELRRMALAVETAGGDVVAGTAARCRESIHHADESLQNARNLARSKSGEEFIAAEIRTALDELGKVVGAVYTDDVLDRIFSRFCVGK
jgi:tRNA modification GTPase